MLHTGRGCGIVLGGLQGGGLLPPLFSGFRPRPTRAVGDAGPYKRTPKKRKGSPFRGAGTRSVTEGLPPQLRFPTMSHTGDRKGRPYADLSGCL